MRPRDAGRTPLRSPLLSCTFRAPLLLVVFWLYLTWEDLWTPLHIWKGDVDLLNCSNDITRIHLSDPPYDNYLYSDCHSSSHVIVTSPLPNSDLNFVVPRLLIAWPAGNSGAVSLFEPANGIEGTLGLELHNWTNRNSLEPIHETAGYGNPSVGVSGFINFNSSAVLTIPILGSIRNIRDYVEGGKILVPAIQDAIKFSLSPTGGAILSRTWFDGVTRTTLEFTPAESSQNVSISNSENSTVHFSAGTYQFNASFNYPQLQQLSPEEVLNPQSQGLIQQNPEETRSLAFLSYTNKLLAGTWRFLTYFGRDTMITLLLMQSVLSEGEGGAIEAVLSAVLERISREDGRTCHEEIIGDYATYLNLASGVNSTDPLCDYKMIDTDFYVPVALKDYFVDTETGRDRGKTFFQTTASFLPDNKGVTYSDLALATMKRIMNSAAPFAADGGQIKSNLIHLEDGQATGEWRDSYNGLGGGRIPYDVNTALVPAALRAISALANAGYIPSQPDWKTLADQYAIVWEDQTLDFFRVTVPKSSAVALVNQYVNGSGFAGPSNTDKIISDVTFYGLALDGADNQSIVRTMNSDDCFRLFLLNTTNQTQLSSFLNQTAEHIIQPFPVGLSSPVGHFVANPAYGGDPLYASIFTKKDYHGTVVWSWPLAMLAAGIARQLGRCQDYAAPDFCKDQALHTKVVTAYNHLWDVIDANRPLLSGEVWSWLYQDGFKAEPMGAFSSTESNIRQLWSLTFLAVQRESF